MSDLLERDRIWCEAIVHSGIDTTAIEAIMRRFNELRCDGLSIASKPVANIPEPPPPPPKQLQRGEKDL